MQHPHRNKNILNILLMRLNVFYIIKTCKFKVKKITRNQKEKNDIELQYMHICMKSAVCMVWMTLLIAVPTGYLGSIDEIVWHHQKWRLSTETSETDALKCQEQEACARLMSYPGKLWFLSYETFCETRSVGGCSVSRLLSSSSDKRTTSLNDPSNRKEVRRFHCVSQGCLGQCSINIVNNIQYIKCFILAIFYKPMSVTTVPFFLLNMIYYCTKQNSYISIFISSFPYHQWWLCPCIYKPAHGSPYTWHSRQPEHQRSAGSRPSSGAPVFPVRAAAEQPARLGQLHGRRGTTEWK